MLSLFGRKAALLMSITTLFLVSNSAKIVYAESPVLYHASFETLDFLTDDILEHARWRTTESRKEPSAISGQMSAVS